MTSSSLRAIADAIRSVSDPGEKIAAAVRGVGEGAAIGTSGQLSGAVMVYAARAAGVIPRVFSIDTLRLFPETYAYMQELETRYEVSVEWYRPDPEELQKMISRHGEWLFFDSKGKQEYCCDVRKVHSNERALHTVDIWFTGLRKDQSASRAGVEEVSWVEHIDSNGKSRTILKVAPLVNWTEDQIREYAAEHDLPLHPLLQPRPDGWAYESLGCVICSTPVGPHEARRSGRWRWQNSLGEGIDKECGIHVGTAG